MASKQKIVEIISAIKTIYSYYAKDTDTQLLVNTWGKLLKNYSDEIVSAAFYKALQSCKVPPTPADVIERINALQKANAPTAEELWVQMRSALKETQRLVYYFRFNFDDGSGITQGERARKQVDNIWNNLPAELKAFIASKEELIRLARSEEDEWKFEKARFIKTLPIIEQRQADKKMLLALEIEMPNIKRIE